MTAKNHLEKWEYNARTAGRLAKHLLEHPGIVLALGNKPFAASIDVTSNCNLRCRHCYFPHKPYQEEKIEDSEFLSKVQNFRKQFPEIGHCTWVGGEPMWRKELLREATKKFPLNWVVTNGTIPIDGHWQNTTFFVSVDGTREIHNHIRQTRKGTDSRYSVYDRAKNTVNTATAPVCAHTVINKDNKNCIPDLVCEWRWETRIKGIAFSLHTPAVQTSKSDEGLLLSPKERADAVAMIFRLKDTYGDFILLSGEQIKNLLPERQLLIYGKNCPLPKCVISLDSNFQTKLPCVMGPGVDCDKCGCTIPAMVESGKRLNIETLRLSLGTLFK